MTDSIDPPARSDTTPDYQHARAIWDVLAFLFFTGLGLGIMIGVALR